MRRSNGVFGTFGSILIAFGFSTAASAAGYSPDKIEELCRHIDEVKFSCGQPELSEELRHILNEPSHPCRQRLLVRLQEVEMVNESVKVVTQDCRPDSDDKFAGYPK